jgi:hypothetical protein
MEKAGIPIEPYYLYLERVAQLAQVFTWPSVLLFDREFRKGVEEASLRWEDESSYLMSLLLRPLPSQPARAGQRKRFDPVSRKEVCIRWQRGQCTTEACKYAHVCMICFGDHQDKQHKGGLNTNGAGKN